MRIGLIAGAVVLAVAAVAPSEAEPRARDAGAASRRREANLIALVGRRLSVRHVEPRDGEPRFDAEYRVRIEVLEVVFGKYAFREMEFSSYVHVGEPAFGKHELGLVYLSSHDGRFVQQKYLFQPVYRTRNDRFASCGDPYAWMPAVHRHGVKAEPIGFRPSVAFDVRSGAEAQGFPSFEAPFFRIENNVATCLMGNYPRELFRVMAEGFLKARGVLSTVPE
jgi:hypothetical protein